MEPTGTPIEIVNVTGTIVQVDGKTLLLKRLPHGLWEMPGGHLEPGETLAECAARELLEETGLRATEMTFLCVNDHVVPAVKKQFIGANFLVTQVEGFADFLDKEEHSAVEWFDVAGIDLMLWRGDITSYTADVLKCLRNQQSRAPCYLTGAKVKPSL